MGLLEQAQICSLVPAESSLIPILTCTLQIVTQSSPALLAWATNGTTVAGSGAAWPVILLWPTDVILDGNGYLYIVEYNNHRVIASGPNGFRCIIACTGTTGSAANQLAGPIGLSFDSQGNLFVTDYSNNRVQKFALVTNSCGNWTRTKLRE